MMGKHLYSFRGFVWKGSVGGRMSQLRSHLFPAKDLAKREVLDNRLKLRADSLKEETK